MDDNVIHLPRQRQPADRAEYVALWNKAGPLEIRVVGKTGRCRHEVNDTFVYKTPYARPEGVCPALLHVLDLYTWRVALGFPSWEADDPTIYRVHCPSTKGTVYSLQSAVGFPCQFPGPGR